MNRFLFLFFWFFSLCPGILQGAEEKPPKIKREFRGVWIATVANIDWPSKKGLSSDQQKEELRAMLDQAVELRLNAIIFQVRPMADALYPSKLEPWSEYLSGSLGKPPTPLYDPLQFALDEAHARGLELHAWFNPYRAKHPSSTSAIPDDHLIKRRPDLAKPYGKHFWLNPTHREVQDHSLSVFLDVVRRYDLDGVHIDDYFYPYKEKDAEKKIIPFPDEDTWEAYQKSGGKLARDDWRRDAVNRFVQRLYREVKALKPWVKVGISPFGIWRPGHPPGIAGLDQYAELYADAKLWLNEGWCDYFSPQLYWPIKQEKQSYPRLLEWWVSQNRQSKFIWPGNYTSKVTNDPKSWAASEIINQIEVTRQQAGATGNVHFSMAALQKNTGGIASALKKIYADPALVPALSQPGKGPSFQPEIKWTKGETGNLLQIQNKNKDLRRIVLQKMQAGQWTASIHGLPKGGNFQVLFSTLPEKLVISGVDKWGQESASVEVNPNK